jgi:site-specific recombinase XerD
MSSRLREQQITLHEAFIQAGLFLRNWSPHTARTYRQGLAALGIEHPTKAQLDQWVVSLRQRGITPGGCNMYIRTINSYLTWLHEEGHIDQRLRVKLLKCPLRVPTLLSPADVRVLIAFKPRTPGERRAWTLTLLLLDTGLRISEALGCERNRIDLDNLLLVVVGKGSKERPVPFSRDLRAVLYRWMHFTRGQRLLFQTRNGLPLSYRNAFRDLCDVCAQAGVRVRVHPHLMRHQFAATYIKKGGDIYRLSRLLGHSAVTTTQTYLRALGVVEMQEGRDHLSPLSRTI